MLCCCGCFGVTRHMKQRSRADRLRGIRTLAVRNRSRIESFGLRQRSGAFTVCFPSWNDILFVCARTPAELVGAWQPPFQKIKIFSGLSSCVPVLLHAIVILIAPFFLFKEFSCSLSLSPSCILCFSRSVMIDWQKYSFGHNARRSREQICVFWSCSYCWCNTSSCDRL